VRIDAAALMQLKRRVYVWACLGCTWRMRFAADQIGAVPFLVVRHLVRDHEIAATRIAVAEPALADEVQDYCRQMRHAE
jgi:hypothetical protein